ncbi:MAG TPA: DUF983 domain-containing protein [Alphaproteobacteria bacterium]
MAETWQPAPSPFSTGLRCRCPACGKGRLYNGLLTVAPKCESCGLDLSAHDSGDGPAVFVIFILGFVVVGAAFVVEMTFEPPLWVHAAIWIPVIIGLAILLLRPAKAIMVALHYKHLRHEYHGG